jgi:zinc protease
VNLIIEPSTQKFLTHFLILIRAGSLADPDGSSGLAHMVARALLRGTRKKSFQQLSEAIEILGGSIAVHVDQTETMIRASVLTQNFDRFLDLLAEIMSEPSFDEAQMKLLKTILEGELEQTLQDPRALVSRALVQKVFHATKASLAPEGSVAGLQRLEAQDFKDLRKYFKANYVSEKILFGVTSALPEDHLKKAIESAFKKIPAAGSTPDKSSLHFPASSLSTQKSRHAVVINREEMSTVPLFIAVSGVSDSDPQMLALEVGNFIFGDEFTARLMQVLRSQNGWTYGAYSGFTQILGPKSDAGLFSVYLFPSVEFVHLAVPKALEMLEAYARDGLSETEFQFAQEALHNRYPFRLDTPEKRLSLRVREFATGRPFRSTQEYRNQLSCLERKTVNDTIRARISTQSLIVAAAGDSKLLKPVFSQLDGIDLVEELEVLV